MNGSKFPKIVAMLRVKNEERWIEKTLKHASDICSGIVIIDDGSTDSTIKICEKFNKVVEIHKQSGLPFDEVRDKNKLLELALRQKPEFILSLDGDEIIQSNAAEILYEELMILYPKADVFEMQSLFIWDDPIQCRYDGVYSNIWYKRLVKMKNQPPDLCWLDPKISQVAHSPKIPNNAVGWNSCIRSRVKILHYGYYDEEIRVKKYQFYNKIDQNNKNWENYIHCISGKGKFSGPNGIEFKQLPKELQIIDIK